MGSLLLLTSGTYGYCLLSGLVPFVNAELFLLAASAAAPRELVIPLILAGTLGQMTAKVAMYGAGRGVIHVPGERVKRWMADAEVWARSRSRAGGGLVLVSAASGFPPFYFVSIACGFLGFRFLPFLTLGFLGRFLRFGAVVMFPQLAKMLLGI